MRIGSLFSGYGGLDLAVTEVLPTATPRWFVESDGAPSRILQHHFSHTPNYGDVTTIDWQRMPPIDILTGGYPCQPFSLAGPRRGETDERHLWPHIRAAIRHLGPRYTFLENVAGHRSLGFDRVLGDLAEDGMRIWWTSLRASRIGAPHHRERLFILAVPTNPDSVGLEAVRLPSRQPAQLPRDHNSDPPLPRADSPTHLLHLLNALDADQAELHTRLCWGHTGAAIRRWGQTLHRDPPPVIIDHVTYRDADLWGNRFPEVRPAINPAFVEFCMGLPEGWVTETPGLSRTDQLRVLGNGVVPQQAAAALRQLLHMEMGHTHRNAQSPHRKQHPKRIVENARKEQNERLL